MPLSQGANVITVTARDAENNTSTDTLDRDADRRPGADRRDHAARQRRCRTAPRETTIALGGTAADEFGVTEVRWSSSRGPSGVANGTTNWGVPAVALQGGIQRHYRHRARRGRQHRRPTRSRSTSPTARAPTVTIVGPTAAATYSTTSATLTLSGTASDAFGVPR